MLASARSERLEPLMVRLDPVMLFVVASNVVPREKSPFSSTESELCVARLV